MTANVLTVGPDTPVIEIAALLAMHGISAVPVINDDNQVVGIVSEGDLVQDLKRGQGPRRSWWLELIGNPNRRSGDDKDLGSKTAKDVMSGSVICADYFTSIPSVAEMLEKNHIKRVPVISHGKLIGIVSRANLVQYLATQNKARLPEAVEIDQAIRQNLLDQIRENGWSKLRLLNVLVYDGIVTYWGLVESAKTKEILRTAAGEIPGVKSVEANMGISTLLDV